MFSQKILEEILKKNDSIQLVGFKFFSLNSQMSLNSVHFEG